MSWKDNITFRGAKSLWTESSGPVEPDKLPLGSELLRSDSPSSELAVRDGFDGLVIVK